MLVSSICILKMLFIESYAEFLSKHLSNILKFNPHKIYLQTKKVCVLRTVFNKFIFASFFIVFKFINYATFKNTVKNFCFYLQVLKHVIIL